MTQNLTDSLAAVHTDGIQFDESYAESYMDWSTRDDNGHRVFEASDGTESIQLPLTHAEMLALHAALTATLIRDGES